MTTTTADRSVDPAKARARRTARMSRFLRILLAITALMHVPVALGVAELATRAGWPSPWLVGLLWGALGTALFVGRARAGMPDRRRRSTAVRLIDIPYYVHWCACLWTLIPSVVATLLGPAIDLARGLPVHLPMGAYMWAYLSGLVVCGYGTLVRRRWFRVVERDVVVPGLDRCV